MYYDLRTVCYEGFLDFIFDHPVASLDFSDGPECSFMPDCLLV